MTTRFSMQGRTAQGEEKAVAVGGWWVLRTMLGGPHRPRCNPDPHAPAVRPAAAPPRRAVPRQATLGRLGWRGGQCDAVVLVGPCAGAQGSAAAAAAHHPTTRWLACPPPNLDTLGLCRINHDRFPSRCRWSEVVAARQRFRIRHFLPLRRLRTWPRRSRLPSRRPSLPLPARCGLCPCPLRLRAKAPCSKVPLNPTPPPSSLQQADGNQIDLSLKRLETVPVRDLELLPTVTIVDLSQVRCACGGGVERAASNANPLTATIPCPPPHNQQNGCGGRE